METILSSSLVQKYKQLSGRCRAVFFSAPCGFGKTAVAQALVTGSRAITLSVREPGFALPDTAGKWKILLLDDLQELEEETGQNSLCTMLRGCPDRRFLLLSRGPLPSWLMPYQTAGVVGVITAQDLLLDRESTARLLQSHGVKLRDSEMAAVYRLTQGYPLALELLAQRMERGETYGLGMEKQIRQDLYLYFEETILRRLDSATRTLLLQVAPFAPVTLELARLVTGDNHAGERLGNLLRNSSMLQPDEQGNFRFWPLFRDFLCWELAQTASESQYRNLYDRAGLCYELAESRFEKGEDIRDRAMKLLAMLDRIRREGTPDIEFAVVGLLARVQVDGGRTQDAKDNLLTLRQRFVQAGETRFLPNQAACYPDHLAPWHRINAPLTEAELQVLRLICADRSNAEIGALLDISLSTVKTHVSRILDKLGVARRSQIKAVARRLHLVEL